VQFGNACSMCVHDDVCALRIPVTPICRDAADLSQQLCVTRCAALITMWRLCQCAVQFTFTFKPQPEKELGLANLKLLHLQSHCCPVLLGTGCRGSLLVLLLMSLLQACVLNQAPPSALARLTGLCLVLRHALKACAEQQASQCYHLGGC